ncbi:hypothetical protein DPMN_179636 [Dreissena polymorpha]|uniref:Uncharacterized protein n=1 Tax=Dreissena polymorpha TaxID=45954 RepID=A0A9D4EF50_DREPO|nr:hypothetical protein DPMN_179636 [Dreissena polymorpha]
MWPRFLYSQIMNTAPTTGCHVFFSFKLDRGIIGTNLLTKFHEDRTRNVASKVFTRKTAPITGGHVFQRTGTTFELNQHIIKTNILTKLHEDWAWNLTSTEFTSFELDRGIIGTNLLSKFHEDRTRNLASRVFTRKTAPPTGGHVFQRTGTIFELDQHISKTNILTNFEIDRGIIGTNLLTNIMKIRQEMWPLECLQTKCGRRTDDRQRPITKAHLSNQVS